MDRREFLGKALGLTVVSAVTPGILTCACEAAAKELPLAFSPFTIDLTTQQFADLQTVGKSVKVTTPTRLIIIRVDDTTFSVLSSRCTHAGTTVGLYNATTDSITCPQHGSQFDKFGVVKKGPATVDLPRYTSTFDGDHTVSITDTLMDVEVEAMGGTLIESISPNPLSSEAQITISLRSQQNIELGMYDVNGNKVASVFEGSLPSGEHQFVFNGTTLPAGAYFCRLTSEAGSFTRQIYIVR